MAATREYLERVAHSRRCEQRVAAAWANLERLEVGNVKTDGFTVRSYEHVVGETTPDGRRVAYDCHYSATTTRHCGAFKAVADEVRPCDHSRGLRH